MLPLVIRDHPYVGSGSQRGNKKRDGLSREKSEYPRGGERSRSEESSFSFASFFVLAVSCDIVLAVFAVG
jgi:hypothetical protein